MHGHLVFHQASNSSWQHLLTFNNKGARSLTVRIERLKEVIREVASTVILQELHDPRIGFCTVTRIDLARDLSSTIVHVSILGTEEGKRTTLRGLKEAKGVIQARVAGALHTRVTPKVDIELDDSVERSIHIQSLIRKARASDPDGGLSPDPEEPEFSNE